MGLEENRIVDIKRDIDKMYILYHSDSSMKINIFFCGICRSHAIHKLAIVDPIIF
jgi:hypothetical protein